MKKQEKLFLYGGLALAVGLMTYYFLLDDSDAIPKRAPNVKSSPIKGHDNLLPRQSFPTELFLKENDAGIFFGKKPESLEHIGKPANKDGHVLVVGSTGSGKTSAVAWPSLLSWRGSTVSLFIKGTYHTCVRQLQQQGRRVVVFDPSAGADNLVRYDLFSTLNSHSEELLENARFIAELLLPLPPEIREPIWVQAAQALLSGAIIFLFSMGYDFPHALAFVQKTPVATIVQLIMESGNDAAISFVSKLSEAELKLMQSTGFELLPLLSLQSQTMLTAFTPCHGCEQLDWAALNTSSEPVDIILAIPEAKLSQWGSLLALMLQQLIFTLMNRPECTYSSSDLPPLLILLDEFPRIGKISAIVHGLNTLRSRGVTFMLLTQSLAGLDTLYGKDMRATIVDDCTYKVLLRISEPESQQYFSDLIGTTATIEKSACFSHSTSFSAGLLSAPISINSGSSRSITCSQGRRPLIYPHAFSYLKDIICITPYGSFQVQKCPRYF